jgi:hypothetical protein
MTVLVIPSVIQHPLLCLNCRMQVLAHWTFCPVYATPRESSQS